MTTHGWSRELTREERRKPTPNKAICNAMAARALTYPAFMFQGGEAKAQDAARKRRNKQKTLRKRRRMGLAGPPCQGVSVTFKP